MSRQEMSEPSIKLHFDPDVSTSVINRSIFIPVSSDKITKHESLDDETLTIYELEKIAFDGLQNYSQQLRAEVGMSLEKILHLGQNVVLDFFGPDEDGGYYIILPLENTDDQA